MLTWRLLKTLEALDAGDARVLGSYLDLDPKRQAQRHHEAHVYRHLKRVVEHLGGLGALLRYRLPALQPVAAHSEPTR